MKKLRNLSFILGVIVSQYSMAQQWFCPGDAIKSDAGGGVFTLAVYNGNLYAAGWFYQAGMNAVSNIAKWNGAAWSDAGSGITGGYANVYALQVYNGKLYAGGAFYAANDSATNDIAVWDGNVWSTTGTGMSTCVSTPSYVTCFAVYNGKLYAGGSFCKAGGIKANNIAVWNGSAWDSVLGGMNGTVNALCSYNGKLYAGGIFSKADTAITKNIAMWDGTSWTRVGKGIRDTVLSMVVYKDSLYAGGNFDSAGNVFAKNIALWNGTQWAALTGGGISGTTGVATLCPFDGYLWAGGFFSKAGNTALSNIARWNGTKWDSIGGGINNTVNSIAVFDSTLYAGGTFSVAGHGWATDIAGWGTYVSGTSELKIENAEVKIYPNPNNGKFNIVIAIRQLAEKQSLFNIEIYNVLGEKIHDATLKQVQGDNQINLGSEPSGIYLYRVTTNSGELISSGKIIIE
jgi:hypothetical protein